MRILLIFSIVLLGCGPVDPPEAGESVRPFFDLAGYVDAEVERLTADETSAEKTVSINGEQETRNDLTIDYAKDLTILRRADINRPAWREKYETVEEGNTIDYRALDSTLATQLLRVIHDEAGEVAEVYVEGRDGSILSQENRRLRYQPGVGYSIYSNRKSSTVGNAEVEVTVRF